MSDEDKRSRKWQLTINNPLEHGFSHDAIIQKCDRAGFTYYCMSDEIGEQGTYHTHVFCYRPNVIRFSTLKKLFPGVHFEMGRATCQENRDYVFKEGKWLNDKKADTNLRDTHYEFGELPVERQGARSDLADLYDMIRSGMTNAEIFADSPQYILQADKIDRARNSIAQDKYKNDWRTLDVTYIWGAPGTGKTKSVMEKYGYSNVCRVTNYKNPFDHYEAQDIILFDEFRSSLPIQDMLNYLDGYPCPLPARYSDKMAAYTKVYIISNIPLDKQYPNVQKEEPDTYKALLRRIHHVQEMGSSSDGFIAVNGETPYDD